MGGIVLNKLIGVLLLMATFFLNTVHEAEALSCAPPQPVMQEIEQSEIVFKGEAIEIKENGLTVFQVDEAWKGVTKSTIQIYDNGWDPYKKGTVYLVFVSQRGENLEQIYAEIQELGTPPWKTP
jgi:hypothetical protein